MKKLFGLSLVVVSAPVLTFMYYSGLFLNKSETVNKDVQLVSSVTNSVEVEKNLENQETPNQSEEPLSKTLKDTTNEGNWKNESHVTLKEDKKEGEKQKSPQAQPTKTATQGYKSNVQDDNYRSPNHPRY